MDLSEAFLLERGSPIAGTSWRPGEPLHNARHDALHNDLRHRTTNFLLLRVAAGVRDHPRFPALVRDIGLLAYRQRSGRWPDHLAGLPLPA